VRIQRPQSFGTLGPASDPAHKHEISADLKYILKEYEENGESGNFDLREFHLHHTVKEVKFSITSATPYVIKPRRATLVTLLNLTVAKMIPPRSQKHQIL